MKLVVDLMGADNSPQELLDGCFKALEKHPSLELTCVVGKDIVEKLVEDKDRIKLVYADEVVNANDNLLTITRRKETSMVKAMNLASQDEFDGIVSAGSTAGFVASSIFIIKRLDTVSRPALCIDLPSINNHPTTFLDLGANVELSNEAFIELGKISSKYVTYTRNIKSPKLSLLNIGEESKKGTNQLKEVNAELSNEQSLNFVGNIESRYLINNDSDIILCDGYSGNLALKAIEGMGVNIFSLIKDAQKQSLRNKLGLLLLKPVFKKMYLDLDYNNYGGAMLLGVKKIAIKAHGSSSSKTFCSAIEQFVKIYESGFIQSINKEG